MAAHAGARKLGTELAALQAASGISVENPAMVRTISPAMSQQKNLLIFGDNLRWLKDASVFPDECVDLIYLDPPFNSQRGYNVLFKEVDGAPSASQIQAFDDTWQWDEDARDRLDDIEVSAPGHSAMFAYLVQMTVRLVQLHRVLRKTGSLYLHCDPTASHYLKVVLDAIFGTRSFKNEIIWQRTNVHSDSKTWSKVSDTIFFYTKSEKFTWNPQYGALAEEHVASKYRNKDGDGRQYQLSDMTSPNPRPNMMYEWKGHASPPNGWRYSRETMADLDKQGRIWYPDSKEKRPRLKRYLDEMPGTLLGNVWTDINPINSQAQERLGYPTQKPLALLQRILLASSNPGDVVLDPFCGCGTTIDAVETVNRESGGAKRRTWIGIDLTHLAISLIKNRLGRFTPPARFEVMGEPTDVRGAEFLARKDRYQFQYWALGLIGAVPWTGEKKKGADKGVDGVRYFRDERDAASKTMLVQVKSGHVKSGDIRDFHGTIDREKAVMGVFITLEEPTRDMRMEALDAGQYFSPGQQRNYPRIQILTIHELLNDPDGAPKPRCLAMPPTVAADTLKQAPAARSAAKAAEQGDFLE